MNYTQIIVELTRAHDDSPKYAVDELLLLSACDDEQFDCAVKEAEAILRQRAQYDLARAAELRKFAAQLSPARHIDATELRMLKKGMHVVQ